MPGRLFWMIVVNSLFILVGCHNPYPESTSVTSNKPDDEKAVSDGETDEDVTDSDTVEMETDGCGNGVIETGEVCDDGNNEPGDGCSATCEVVEEDFACSMPGEPCVSTVEYGDGRISGEETCDDRNTEDGDGCSSTGQIEKGWVCAKPGEPCQAKECGDGAVAGRETCDDGNTESGDGCSATCQLENGWACEEGECHETVCNDGVREGKEPCDDGNMEFGDGCTPLCEIEPDCSGGACRSSCGDGLILPGDNEDCDDGNAINGDGCSDTCKIEDGFECITATQGLPDELNVPIIFRDFISNPADDGEKHPDFDVYSGDSPTLGLVEKELGEDGKPVYTGICELDDTLGEEVCPYQEQTTSLADFDVWYRDVPGINITEVSSLLMKRQDGGEYWFPDGEFFPWDDKGWVEAGMELPVGEDEASHNYGFTSEIRYWFEFKGDEYLKFAGDDDVWVFINGRLAVDLGGLHPYSEGDVKLTEEVGEALGLEKGKVYEIVLFHAERHTFASNFNLTLNGFASVKSHCESFCGDGIVTAGEACDDGVNDGSYGSCGPNCTLGDFCGDGIVQKPEEECDDGINMAVHSLTTEPACGPGCVLGSYCGDGKVDSLFGEQCDDGVNEGGYDGCNPDCTLGERCGDGILQEEEGEYCDDGNTVSGDGCSSECLKPAVV